MGDSLPQFRFDFNGSLRVEARPEHLTSDGGALVLREILEKLGIIPWFCQRITDPRDPDLLTHPLAELLRTMLLLLGQGWRDQDDADLLRDDPALRLAVSERRGLSPLEQGPRQADGGRATKNPAVPDGLASQPTLSRLVELLSQSEHRGVLRGGLLEFASQRLKIRRGGHRPRYLTVDLDSLPIEVSGHQPGSQYNGHYHARIFHPLIASVGETGDLLDGVLREGNAHTAAGGCGFILPLLDEVEAKLCQVASLRMDAGFPEEALLAALEARRTGYVARVKNNAVLDRLAAPYLRRPPGRPPLEGRTWFYEERYQAESWSTDRRVVLIVQERPGELYLHYFWLITNWTVEQMRGTDLLGLYRERGTAEGHMGELMSVLKPALSSSPRSKEHYRGREPQERQAACDSFAHNEVLMLLNMLAYNLCHAARVMLEGATGDGWSLRRLRERVLKVGARIITHGGYATLVMAQLGARYWRALLSWLTELRPAET